MSKTKSKTSKAKISNQEWWSDQEESPRADIPSAKKLRKRTTLYRRVIWATLFLFPVTLLALFVAVSNTGEESGPAFMGPPPTEATAISSIITWIDQKPSPLPGGRVISWDSYEKAPLPTGRDKVEGIESLEVHTLTVAAPTGALFTTTVQIAVGDSIGETVVSTPTLVPLPPSGTDGTATSSLTPWPTLESSTATEGAETAIKAWAEAFTSGDPAALLNVVGDERGGVSYVPLSGLTFDIENYSIDAVAGIFGDDQDRTEPSVVPEKMIVSVTFEGQWAGVQTDVTTQSPQFTYDLLISRANTASPRVVAWGGYGSGSWLKEYGNAVKGRVISGEGLRGPVGADDAATDGSTTEDPADGVDQENPQNDNADEDLN